MSVVHTGSKALARLDELGLTVDDIEFALSEGDAEARTYTEYDPPSTHGIGRWGRTNRGLREQLCPQGWTYDNPRNLPRTISPARDIAIVATTGDANTGIAEVSPTTKYAKGAATADAVNQNADIQLAFDIDMPGLEAGEALAEVVHPGDDQLRVWLLLYLVLSDTIRWELSCPASITKQGFVDDWTERIIVKPFPIVDPSVEAKGDDGGDDDHGIDVPVERR